VGVNLTLDEIEVACDALWANREKANSKARQLWDRLQPLRAGDYGARGSIKLKQAEGKLVADRLREITDVELDDDEQALLEKLEGLGL
jgi:hypothetical protein